MLWYKAWLETRWRMALIAAVLAFVLFQVATHSQKSMDGVAMLTSLQFMWMIIPLSMAGAGVRTENPFRAVKGIQGSIYYTMSLPVSRLQLLAVRAGVGLAETGLLIAVGIGMAAAAFPAVRMIPVNEAASYVMTIFVCGLSGFGISTLYATFLDQQWQAMASMLTFFLARGTIFGLDGARWSRFDFFRVMGEASPLVTHGMPWVAMGVSLIVAAICFAGAVKVEEARQY